MLDIDTLKCKMVLFTYYFLGKTQWGITCDAILYQNLLSELYNYIAIIENISQCDVDDEVWDNIAKCIERLNVPEVQQLCNNC